MRRGLIPFDIPKSLMGEPLPHDVFNSHGVLVLPQGYRISDSARMGRLTEMDLYRPGEKAPGTLLTPAEYLSELAKRFSLVTRMDNQINLMELTLLADDLHTLAKDHPEICLGMVRHLTSVSQARSQAMFVAILGCLVAKDMGLDIRVQRTIIRAALSMNLTSFEAQDELRQEGRMPHPDECERLWAHPWKAAEILANAGVKDANWLNAVRQHHENLDTTGYPCKIGATEITEEARILRVVDVFTAMISQRQTRIGYAPHKAMRLAFERERGHLDDSVMLTLRKVIGKYPPGTLVKLANRETAVVTRWFRSARVPKFVVSLLRPSGEPLLQPYARNTGQSGYSIREHVSLPSLPTTLNWATIWAQGLA